MRVHWVSLVALLTACGSAGDRQRPSNPAAAQADTGSPAAQQSAPSGPGSGTGLPPSADPTPAGARPTVRAAPTETIAAAAFNAPAGLSIVFEGDDGTLGIAELSPSGVSTVSMGGAKVYQWKAASRFDERSIYVVSGSSANSGADDYSLRLIKFQDHAFQSEPIGAAPRRSFGPPTWLGDHLNVFMTDVASVNGSLTRFERTGTTWQVVDSTPDWAPQTKQNALDFIAVPDGVVARFPSSDFQWFNSDGSATHTKLDTSAYGLLHGMSSHEASEILVMTVSSDFSSSMIHACNTSGCASKVALVTKTTLTGGALVVQAGADDVAVVAMAQDNASTNIEWYSRGDGSLKFAAKLAGLSRFQDAVFYEDAIHVLLGEWTTGGRGKLIYLSVKSDGTISRYDSGLTGTPNSRIIAIKP